MYTLPMNNILTHIFIDNRLIFNINYVSEYLKK